MNLCRIAIISSMLLLPAFSLNPLNTMGPGTPGAGSRARIVNDDYINLRNNFNPNTLVLDNFETSLQTFLTAINGPASGNSQALINRLTRIYNNLQGAIDGPPALANNNSFRKIFIDAKQLVLGRLKRAKIDHELANGNNVANGFGNLPANVRTAVSAISGSIFHIIRAQNGTETIRRVGSGIALPPLANVNNAIVALNNQNLTIVLTCAHVLKAAPNTRIEVYFVPDTELHGSGWPRENLPGLAPNPITNAIMAAYLRTGAQSFKINTFRLNNTANPLFNAGALEGNNPRYFNSEDVAIGNISLRAGQAPFVHNDPANPVNITLISTSVNIINHIGGLRINHQNMFATGRPGMHHHNVNGYMVGPESVSFRNWVNTKGKSPRITSRLQAAGVPPGTLPPAAAVIAGYPQVINNNLIRHTALTAKGMSGGTLLSVVPGVAGGPPTIQVFGVVNSGTIAHNTAGFIK